MIWLALLLLIVLVGFAAVVYLLGYNLGTSKAHAQLQDAHDAAAEAGHKAYLTTRAAFYAMAEEAMRRRGQ